MTIIAQPCAYEPVFNKHPSSLSLLFFNYLGRRCFIIPDVSKPNQVTELPYKLEKSGIALRVALLFTVVVPAIALICTAINWYTNRKSNYQIILQPIPPKTTPATTTPAKKPLETRKPDYTFPANHPRFPNAHYYGKLSTGESWQGVPGQPFGQGTIHLSEESPIESISGDFSVESISGNFSVLTSGLAETKYRNGDRFQGPLRQDPSHKTEGVMYYANGDIVHGLFKDGQPKASFLPPYNTSKSTFLLKNGLKMEAEDLEDGKFSSYVHYEYYHRRSTLTITEPLSLEQVTQQVLQKFESESHYEGGKDPEGRYHGQGTLTVNREIVFDGTWINGEMRHGTLHGETERTSPDKSTDCEKFTYTGHFKNNKMDTSGEGTDRARYSDSHGVYLGHFKDNLMDTTGRDPATYEFKNPGNGKTKYEGHFKNGLMDTTGREPATCYYVNGDRYEGAFVKGKRDSGRGKATYRYQDSEGSQCHFEQAIKDDLWVIACGEPNLINFVRKHNPGHTFY